MKTDPKDITLTAEQLDWVITSLKNEIGSQPWEYDRITKLHWIGNEELRVQIDLDTQTKRYRIHTW